MFKAFPREACVSARTLGVEAEPNERARGPEPEHARQEGGVGPALEGAGPSCALTPATCW